MSNLPTRTSEVPAELQEAMTSLVLNGDLSRLNPQQKAEYYFEMCRRIGLDPMTKPFDLLKLNNKEVLYANKNCAEQLRSIYDVSVTSLETKMVGDTFVVTANVENRDGRRDTGLSAISLKNLTGEALANAMMKGETKAKRRASLSICGLGMLDESEVDTIPNAKRVKIKTIKPELLETEGQTVDMTTGEILTDTKPEHPSERKQYTEPREIEDTRGIDWTTFMYKYHLPHKKEGENMQAIRDQMKASGAVWRPEFTKNRETGEKLKVIGGDNCWYTNTEHKDLVDYMTMNFQPATTFADDDIPFNY